MKREEKKDVYVKMVGLLSRISFFSLIKSRGPSRTWKFITRKIAAPRSCYLDVKAATELINRTRFSDLIFIVPRGTIVELTGLRGISISGDIYTNATTFLPFIIRLLPRFTFVSLSLWFLRTFGSSVWSSDFWFLRLSFCLISGLYVSLFVRCLSVWVSTFSRLIVEFYAS